MENKQTVSRWISIKGLHVFIRTYSKKRVIDISKISKVYISYELLSTKFKYSSIFILVVNMCFICAFSHSFSNITIGLLLHVLLYKSLTFFKYCTFNLELKNEKVKVRFIPYGRKEEVVSIVQKIRGLIAEKKGHDTFIKL